MEHTIYFNVPIQLISDFFLNKKAVVVDVMSYACYNHCYRHKLSIEDALEYFDLGCFWDMKDSFLEKGETLFNSIPPNSPPVGINKMKLFEFLTEDKSEFEIACFLAFLSIRSILRDHSYKKIDNDYLLSRMDGKVCSVRDTSELSESIRKFSTEYQLVKIKKALILDWGLIHYSRYNRGFYVSFKMKLEDLIYQAELNRKSNKQKELKKANDEAYKRAMNRINQTRP